mgnify:FL=1
MKIAVCSDLHLEFDKLELKNTEGADVLVLSGDICVAADVQENDSPELTYGYAGMASQKSKNVHAFFQNCCKEFGHVIYVMGNHEHYHYDFKYTFNELKKRLGYLDNLVMLDKQAFTLGDVCFVGGTMWTDMNKEDPFTLFHVKDAMSDFVHVKNSNRMVTRKVPLYAENLHYTEDGKNGPRYIKDEKGNMFPIGYKDKEEPSRFSPEDSVKDHKEFLEYLKIAVTMLPCKYVVCTHHTPTPMSIHEKYKHDELMNGAYTSNLSEFILDHPKIKLWTHGHTHEDFDYMVGTTRVVCNPRGYSGYESRADRFQLKYVEV